MAVNWALGLQQSNPGEAFANAFQHGMQVRRQEQEAALQRQAQALEQHREAIKLGAQIIRQINPQDQAGWDAALGALRQMGVDPDGLGVPRQWMPEYAKQIVGIADALSPRQGGDGFTLSPGQVRFDANGNQVATGGPERPRYYSVPPGGMLVPEPGIGTGPQPLTDEDIMRLEGGQSPQGSGGFPQGPF